MKRRRSKWIPNAWPLLLTRAEVCEYLGIPPERFFEICPVPPVDLGAKVIRYHRWQILEWANAMPPSLMRYRASLVPGSGEEHKGEQ